jgi:hypothetical protein
VEFLQFAIQTIHWIHFAIGASPEAASGRMTKIQLPKNDYPDQLQLRRDARLRASEYFALVNDLSGVEHPFKTSQKSYPHQFNILESSQIISDNSFDCRKILLLLSKLN